jgi:PAS domain S-box-containing protein
MTPSTIRLLLLEDNPADAELLQDILLDAEWVDWQVQSVSRLGDALRFLKNQPFDVVLSDLHLPDARGLETLKCLKAAADVPIVALTSLNDAQLALEAVSLGAQDYLVKGQINNLLLERSLRYAIERDRTQRLLRQSEERFRIALHQSPVCVFQQDCNLRYTWIYNPCPGFEIQEIVGKQDSDLFPAAEAALLTKLKQAVLAGECCQFPEIALSIQETLHYFQLSLEPLYDALGKIVGVSGAATNISDRKRAELALQRLNEELEERVEQRTQELLASQAIIRERESEFRALVENSPDAVGRFDRDWRYLYMNPAIFAVTGLPPETFIGKNLIELEMPEAVVTQWQENLRSVFATGAEVVIETDYETPTNGWRTYQTRLVPEYNAQGEVATVLAIARDISPLKQTQAQLQQTNQLLNAIIAAAPVYIDLVDPDGKVRLWNPAAERIFGWSVVEALGQMPPMIPAELRDRFFGYLSRTLAGESLNQQENRYQRKDGTWVDISLSTARILDAQDRPIGAIGIIQDISDRVAAEAQLQQLNQELEQRVCQRTRQLEKSQERLQQSNARLQYLLASSPTILYSCEPNLEAKARFISHNIAAILGYNPQEIIDKGNFWSEKIHPHDREKVKLEISDLYDWGYATHEYRFRHKNGSYRWIRDDLRLICDEHDKPIEIVGSIIDISDRVAAENALKLSEERLNLALESTSDGLWDWNVQTGECYFSPRWLEMLGYEVGDLSKHISAWQPLVHTDDEALVRTELQRHLNGESDRYVLEHRLRHKSGQWRWILGRGQVVARNAQGEPLRMVGTNTDIHDRKEAEAKLQQQIAAIEAATDGIAVLNENHEFVYLNTAHVRLFGYEKAEELLGRLWLELYDEDEGQRLQAELCPTLSTLQTWRGEAIAKRKDGSTFPQEVSLTIVDGVGLICVCQDISDRKQAQHQLQQSESKLLEAQRIAHLGSWDYDTATQTVNWSDELFRIHGLDNHQITPTIAEIIESIHPDDRALWQHHVNQGLQNNQAYEFDFRIVRPDGSLGYLSAKGQPVVNAIGEVIQLFGTVLDVTTRKQAEEQLRTSLHEKELLLKEVHHRVKNNLQVISGIFYLQSQYIDDPEILAILTDSQNRIESMALIHEKLYRSENFAKVDLSTYIEDLTSNLFASYNLSPRLIRLRQQVIDANLPLDAAIPCGLLVNELVSNALKHAFPNGRTGEIYIQFMKNQKDELDLIVRDNGIGIPAEFNIEKTNSLGLRLVRNLARQLKGKLTVYNDNGAVFCLTFPQPKERHRF